LWFFIRRRLIKAEDSRLKQNKPGFELRSRKKLDLKLIGKKETVNWYCD
jgi:hypothetical protein